MMTSGSRPPAGTPATGPAFSDLHAVLHASPIALFTIAATGVLTHLSGQVVTDAGLDHLKGLTKLETLVLNDTQVSDAGVENLEKAWPNCTISHRQ